MRKIKSLLISCIFTEEVKDKKILKNSNLQILGLRSKFQIQINVTKNIKKI